MGTFKLGINSQSNGNLIMSDRNFLRVFPEHAGATEGENAVTVGVLRVRPGTDLPGCGPTFKRRCRLTSGFSRSHEFIARERDFWDHVAPIGTVFYIGVVMGFIVGSVICYQVLFSDISDRIGEFATLKAMGYSNLRLFRVVVMQGVYLAVLGYLAGLVVSLLLFRWVHEATGLAHGPVAERSPGHPGSLGGHVRSVGSLRGAQAALGRPRAAILPETEVSMSTFHERHRHLLHVDRRRRHAARPRGRGDPRARA